MDKVGFVLQRENDLICSDSRIQGFVVLAGSESAEFLLSVAVHAVFCNVQHLIASAGTAFPSDSL